MLRRLFRGGEREMNHLQRNVKRMMSVQKREVRGVADVIFTVGRSETIVFKAENESRRGKGEPYYVRVKNDIGKEKLVVIWVKYSSNRGDFLTDIVLSSTEPNHKHFCLGNTQGYKLLIHPEMRGMAAVDPTLCLMAKKEAGKSRFVTDVRVSYTKDDHMDLRRQNYEMLPVCLSNFGLSYANVWIRWTTSSLVRLTNADHLEKELKDYSEMLSKSPENKILLQMVDEVKWRLREAQLAEEEHAKDIPKDDLTYTKEFLALKSRELAKCCSVFRKSIANVRGERISIDDYCIFLREPLSIAPFIRQIFELSASSTGMLVQHPSSNNVPIFDVGATLKATAVFCMFCSPELMKFVFNWQDPRGTGFIENKQFLAVLGIFHPRHRDDVLAGTLKKIDLPLSEMMSFSEFECYMKKFPRLLYPAFRVQEKMRQKFFGSGWWKRKLRLYCEARKHLELERKRSHELEDKERRQRYAISEELKDESIELSIAKRRNRRQRS